jgi:hypothetical protein
MNVFIALGLLCLVLAHLYQSPREYWRMIRSTPGEIYRGYREGRLKPKPAWASALDLLGIGLMVLGFWRLWSGQ